MKKKNIKIIVAISFLFLTGCAQFFTKKEVTKSSVPDAYGEPITTYKECQNINVLDLEPRCHVEVIRPQYCYRTLGQIECHDHPLQNRETIRRVK